MDVRTYLVIAFFTIIIGATIFTSLPWFMSGTNEDTIGKIAVVIIYGTWVVSVVAIVVALDGLR